MIHRFWQWVQSYIHPTELDIKRRIHNRGLCNKAQGGYTCRGRNNYAECE